MRLGLFTECRGVLPTTQFAYRKGLGTCDSLLCDTQPFQSTVERGKEVRIVQIDLNAAVDRVNHRGIVFRLCSVGVGGFVLSVLTTVCL